MRYGYGLLPGVMVGMMLIAGLLIGAHAVAADNPQPDVAGLMEDELFHANGSIDVAATEPAVQPPGVERVEDRVEDLGPDTPRYDAALRQWLIRPLLLAAIWLTDFGTRLGYGLASVIGPDATVLLGQAGAVGLVAVPLVRVYRVFSEVRNA
jgi:hypothetical protein